VASGSIRNVPWRLGVVKAVGVKGVIFQRYIALICMHVARQYEVNVIFDEVRLEDTLALQADSTASIFCADIPRAMAGCFTY
jgi:hypothetical protein